MSRVITAVRKKSSSTKTIIFLCLAVVVLITAGVLMHTALFRRLPTLSGTVIDVKGSMAGFDPAEIRVKVGQPITLRLTSLDSPLHKGGGEHQLAIDEFGINLRAAARQSATVTFTPTKAGTYDFYCDVCCGGKASPSMNGKFIVEA